MGQDGACVTRCAGPIGCGWERTHPFSEHFSTQENGATMEYTGSRMIKATGTTIANILADIRRLPEWNHAILSVPTYDSPAIAQKEYSIRAKLPGSPTMTYEEVSRGQII